jgi:tetratricopeptide (TPR) repeat protein
LVSYIVHVVEIFSVEDSHGVNTMASDLAKCVLPILLALYSMSPAASGAAEAGAPGIAVSTFDKARARQQDAETLRSLTDEGRLLYQKDRIKLDGFQYCGQAIALAERGEFRQSIQAASKALIIGEQQKNGRLVASAKRDLAITYSYAGDLEQAAHYAREALAGPDGAAPAIAGPSQSQLE